MIEPVPPSQSATRVQAKRLHPDALLPRRMSEAAAGLDCFACLPDGASVELEPGKRALIPTGIALAIPEGLEGQVRPRSGLAFRHGITVVNSPGTIDADYRGELKVLLGNMGSEPFTVSHGDRIAQLVIAPVVLAAITEVEELGATSRGSGGFGSTGV